MTLYPNTLDDAVEAAEIFTSVGALKIIGDDETAGILLGDYITHGCDHSRHCEHSAKRLTHLIITGAMVVADTIRTRSPLLPSHGFWALDTEALEHIYPPDLAAMRLLTTTLNSDHGAAQDVLTQYVTEHGIVAATEVLGATIGLYVAAFGVMW